MEWEPVERNRARGTAALSGHRFTRFLFPKSPVRVGLRLRLEHGTAYETKNNKGGCGWESDSESVSGLGEEENPHLPLA
ncbi:hypothetical protein PAHAL_5G208500 [Panicum hallii]|uniref:Uncharacterized protein n=1 Tax=Panicum hallii TaxID=206008 RepID=A0A2T8IKP2_9POAL|nr:hypothetical protein PAHAL_5G208500 [Panicum hallii]